MGKEVYYDIAIGQIPRLLGQLDRNRNSSTHGCFDRNYWHYKIIDFACARHQEAALTLSLLYKLNQRDNIYFDNENILRWINAALKFWCGIQNKDGSFNEWYPNERSFVATAFSSYAVSECLISLGNKVKERGRIMEALSRAGEWLLKRSEYEASNQTSGAILFLYNLHILTGNKKYLASCRNKLVNLLSKQNREGWWNEYNGADIGYLSLTVDYLSKLLKKFPDKKLRKSIGMAIDFLSYFIHPNMTFGGEYGSRNTEFMVPHGIELNAKSNRNAASIASAIRASLKSSSTIAPYSIDDRYLCYMSYVWLQAYLNSKNDLKNAKYRFYGSFTRNFKNARILIVSNTNFYIVINYSKGGAFVIYPKNGDNYINDSGISALDAKNNQLTSSWISNNKIGKNKKSITIKGKLLKLKDTPMTALRNLGLRSFAKTFGRSQRISSLMKNVLRKKLIVSSVKSNAYFSRQFIIGERSIQIIDSILSGNKLKSVFLGEKYSNLFIPSSRYFQLQELGNKPLEFSSINSKSFRVGRSFVFDEKSKKILGHCSGV